MTNLSFKPFSEFPQSTLFDMLMKSYATYPELVEQDKKSWEDYDKRTDCSTMCSGPY